MSNENNRQSKGNGLMTKSHFDNEKDHSSKELIRQIENENKRKIEARREIFARQVAAFERHLGCEVKRHKPVLVIIDGGEPEWCEFVVWGHTVALSTSKGYMAARDVERIKPHEPK